MTRYELMLAVDPLNDEQEVAVVDRYDAVPRTFAGGCVVALAAEGGSTVRAVQGAVAELAGLGIQVQRVVEDLVTREMIGERAGVTRQTVGQWARGEELDFPGPFTASGGGLWLWGPVNRWLGSLNPDLSDGFTHPEPADYVEANYWLLLSRRGTL